MKTALHPRFHAILISPQGEEFYLSYRGVTQDHTQAVRFVSPAVANVGAQNHFGHSGKEFWECERKSAEAARRKYRGWTHRVEPSRQFQAPFTLWIAPVNACASDVFPVCAPFNPRA